jgi:predicted small metal-binding protein
MANNPTTGSNQGNVKFRCKDVGFANCPFEASGKNEQELMPQIERHGKEAHGMEQIDQQTRDRVKDAIRPAA